MGGRSYVIDTPIPSGPVNGNGNGHRRPTVIDGELVDPAAVRAEVE